jgi:tetratricopeptide (TPR) repeat protein
MSSVLSQSQAQNLRQAHDDLVRGAPAAAIQRLLGLLRQAPRNPDALHLLGGALDAVGDKPAARTAFADAIKAAPRAGAPHDSLANLLAGLGELDEALAHHAQAVALEPSNADFQLNHCRVRQGDHAHAAFC